MTFLSLTAFALLPLLPAIVIFYMLKLKRKREVVPSTLLWRRSVADLIANSPFQKLRNNLLMYLQLLILAALIFALARPVVKLEREQGNTIVLLIDQSASMLAKDSDGKTRIEKAREQGLKAVEGLGANDQMIIVGFSNRTQIIQTLSGDKGLLREAVRSIEASETEVNLSETALILEGLTTSTDSEAVRTARADVKTLLISDGGLGEAAEQLGDVPNMEYVKIGSAVENLGVTTMDLRESFAGEYEQQVFASVWNGGTEARTVLVDLKIDDQNVDVKSVDVPPLATSSVVFSVQGGRTGIASVSLPAKGDALEIDDVARAIIPPPSAMNILIVTKGNFFLEQALNVDSRVTVSRILPTDYENHPGEYDLTVFDNCTTGKIGIGTFLFLNALPPGGDFKTKKEASVSNPAIVDWNRVHPIMRYVNMDRVLVGEAMNIEVPRDAVPLVEAVETPLISYYETDARQVLVIGFDIFKSYWPVDVSFPIFISNVIDFARRQRGGAQRPAYATGSTIPIVAPKGATTLTVLTPSANSITKEFAGATTAFLTETSEAGIYNVRFDTGETRNIAVNVFSERESTIEPVENLQFGGKTLSSLSDTTRAPREIWPWLAMLAFAVLSIEWWVYCKRAWL